MQTRTANIVVCLVMLLVAGLSQPALGQTESPTPPQKQKPYAPLNITSGKIKTLELTVKDGKRSREVPLLIYLPATEQPAPVIIHSHGLGGTKNTSPFLGKHWAARGFLAVFVQHPGSDDSVLKDVPKLQRMRAMSKAAGAENLTLRIGDVNTVIDQLERWNVEANHALNHRLSLDQIGMSGHSFGAITTQHLSGMAIRGTQRSLNKKIKAALPMSPSTPRLQNAKNAFAQVSIPWLCMTGTHDVSLIGGASVESRLAVYLALPAGDKYELVLHEADHSAFTEKALSGDRKKRNPNHHTAIKAISTAFWDAHLRNDPAAKEWLHTESVRSVLGKKDRWQFQSDR